MLPGIIAVSRLFVEFNIRASYIDEIGTLHQQNVKFDTATKELRLPTTRPV